MMVFELLGPNLEDLFRYCGNRFSMKTTLMDFDQLLRRFESLHSVQYLHQDVKPENFLMKVGRRGNLIYMTDLSLAIEYYSDLTVSGSTSVRDPQLIGTYRYASINGHLGIAQSRGDDLEALGYMMLYFIIGPLPWQGVKALTRKQKYRLVLEKKQTTSVVELCGDLLEEFAIYMNYVRDLRHENKPDYRYLRRIFRHLFRRQGFEYDQVFDWTIREHQRQSVECAEQSEGPSTHVTKKRGRKRTRGPTPWSVYKSQRQESGVRKAAGDERVFLAGRGSAWQMRRAVRAVTRPLNFIP